MKIKLTGFRELEEALAQLPKSTSKAVCRRALKAEAKPIAAVAQALAPRRSGDLEIAVTVSTQLTRRHRAEAREGKSEVEVYIGPKSGRGVLNYATKAEYDYKAYMRPAWFGAAGGLMPKIGARLWTEIAKSAARLARKRAKGG